MAEVISNIAIMTKTSSIEAEEAAGRITGVLTGRNIKVYAVYPLIIEGSRPVKAEDLRKLDLDIVFAIGGDGTTLRAFRYIPRETPLLSVNVGGNRGILSETGIDSLDESIKAILLGHYFRESRIRIQGFAGKITFPAALNDIGTNKDKSHENSYAIHQDDGRRDGAQNGRDHNFYSDRLNRTLVLKWWPSSIRGIGIIASFPDRTAE